MKRTISAILCASTLCCATFATAPIAAATCATAPATMAMPILRSTDGSLSVTFALVDGSLRYDISNANVENTHVLSSSKAELEFAEFGQSGYKVVNVVSDSKDDSWDTIMGTTDHVEASYKRAHHHAGIPG